MGARFWQGPLPGGEIAFRVVSTAVEGAALASLAHDQVAATFRTLHPDLLKIRLGVSALREVTAGDELAIAAPFDHHGRAALLAKLARGLVGDLHLRHIALGLLQRPLEWPPELA